MKKYVVGFATTSKKTHVALIRKKHPDWQKGKLNGIGGHIEPTDKTPACAMAREFWEETGIETHPDYWREFVCVKGNDYELHCFTTRFGVLAKLKKTTDEKPAWYRLDTILKNKKILASLHWLIPMAIYKFQLRGEIWHGDPEC
jgi:8-oxo-dGTP diphosphatase